MENKLMESALHYAEIGLSVIPVGPNKVSLVKWQKFQKKRAKREEIEGWWSKWPEAMIGLVTGKLSNLLVIDCDTLQSFEKMKSDLNDLGCPMVRTPRGGHLYFSYPEDLNPIIKTQIQPDVDYRGQGGYVIAPPSTNSEGKTYEWIPGASLDDVMPPPPPAKVKEIILKAYKNKKEISLYRGYCERSINAEPNNDQVIDNTDLLSNQDLPDGATNCHRTATKSHKAAQPAIHPEDPCFESAFAQCQSSP